jgi:hypothetical protein
VEVAKRIAYMMIIFAGGVEMPLDHKRIYLISSGDALGLVWKMKGDPGGVWRLWWDTWGTYKMDGEGVSERNVMIYAPTTNVSHLPVMSRCAECERALVVTDYLCKGCRDALRPM